jgi:hypothetical protein
MLPRIVPAIFIVLIFTVFIAGCAQKTETASAPPADSLSHPGDSTVAQAPKNPWVRFEDDELFTKLLPFDISDTVALRQWFPNYDSACDVMYYEDGTVWYKVCTYETKDGSFKVGVWDYDDNDPYRHYFYTIDATDPQIKFAKGIHAGMSKQDFLDAVNLNGHEDDNQFWAIEDTPGGCNWVFEFADEKLKSIDMRFAYDSMPKALVDFVSSWKEVSFKDVLITEGEDEVERAFYPCEARSYSFEVINVTVGDKEVEKYLLNVGMVQDSRTDTVEWVQKTDDGFLISAFNSWAGGEPYTVRVSFKDKDWTIADWDFTTFVTESYPESVYEEGCDGLEPGEEPGEEGGAEGGDEPGEEPR